MRCFNPRPCGRSTKPGCVTWQILFQSTPRGRGDNRFGDKMGGIAKFQSSSLRGATCTRATCARFGFLFQSTPLREGRHGLHGHHVRGLRFNPRPFRRGDTCMFGLPDVPVVVSTHAPNRGATFCRVWLLFPRTFQSTPLREGRRCKFVPGIVRISEAVSIHVPVRGATTLEGRDRMTWGSIHHVSIHAHAEGTTMQVCSRSFVFPASIHVFAKGASTLLYDSMSKR